MTKDVEFSPEDASRTEPEFLARVVQAAIEAGATTVTELTLDPLLVGKIGLADEPLVADLLDRGVLVEPPLKPRFLESREALDRLARIQDGAGILELGGVAA